MIESPVVSIHVPPALRTWVEGHEEVTASGDTVGDALHALEHVFPAIAGKVLLSNGQLQPFFDVYLGATSIRTLAGLATPIGGEEVISIIPRRTRVGEGEISVG